MKNTNFQKIQYLNSSAARHPEISIDKVLFNQYYDKANVDRWFRYYFRAFTLLTCVLGVYFTVIDGWIGVFIFLVSITLFLTVSYVLSTENTTRAYKTGTLVPAIVSSIEPIQVIALVNVAIDVDGCNSLQWAAKRIKIRNLPIHRLRLGERVVCTATGTDRLDGIYTNFNLFLLAWATSSIAEIRCNENMIPLEEWEFLSKIVPHVPKHWETQMALFDHDGSFARLIYTHNPG